MIPSWLSVHSEKFQIQLSVFSAIKIFAVDTSTIPTEKLLIFIVRSFCATRNANTK